MADCISTWLREEAEGTPVLFECPAAVEDRLRRRKALRDLGTATPAAARRTLRDLGIDPGAGTGRHWIDALIERYASDDLDAAATVPAHLAISALADRIRALRGVADAA